MRRLCDFVIKFLLTPTLSRSDIVQAVGGDFGVKFMKIWPSKIKLSSCEGIFFRNFNFKNWVIMNFETITTICS